MKSFGDLGPSERMFDSLGEFLIHFESSHSASWMSLSFLLLRLALCISLFVEFNFERTLSLATVDNESSSTSCVDDVGVVGCDCC
jgi:hypothetical protein